MYRRPAADTALHVGAVLAPVALAAVVLLAVAHLYAATLSGIIHSIGSLGQPADQTCGQQSALTLLDTHCGDAK